jgi:TolB-like protein
MARRARELDPDNEEGVRRLMELLDRRGDRGGALKLYAEWQARLLEDYGVEPAPETRRIANRVRAARKGESHETPPTPLKPTQVLPAQGDAPVVAAPSAAGKPRRSLGSLAAVAVLILAVIVATAMLWPDSPWKPRAGEHSISVLPLRSIGGDPLPSIADAVTEELTTTLATHTGVTVRPATRAQSLLRDGADIDKVGRRLGVAYIADASVQGNAERIRLTLRLLRAEDAVTIWANTFDFMPESLPAVARSVADSLAAAVGRARK